MKIGISSYTYVWWAGVPGYPQPVAPLTPMRLLDVAAELGVDVVQIADNMPLDAWSEPALDALAQAAASRGLTLETGTHGISPGHLARHLKIAQRLHAKMIRTLLDRPASEAAVLLRESAPHLEAAGVTLGIENHDHYPAAVLRQLIEQVNSPNIGICLDTANSLGCGEGIHEVLSALAPCVVNLHIKDFTVRRLTHLKGFIVEGAPAGQGLLDLPSIREQVRDVSVILEQWPAPEATVEESIAKEIAWAREGVAVLKSVFGAASRTSRSSRDTSLPPAPPKAVQPF